jgi:hypothetical protein
MSEAATVQMSGAGTGPRLSPVAVEVRAINGSTTPNIAAVLRIGTGLPRTGSGAPREAIPLPNVRPALAKESTVRAEAWPAM